MRGNRRTLWSTPAAPGSIPAYAGEPLTTGDIASVSKVYPRVCGGTADLPANRPLADGLSPRMRGNRVKRQGWQAMERSIPAYAGEPAGRLAHQRAVTVYPRVCGGTPPSWPPVWNRNGLSPRMRGNRPASPVPR